MHSYPCQPTYTVYIRTLIYVHSVLYLPSCCAVKQKEKKKNYTQQTHCFFLNFTKLVKLIWHMSRAGLNLLASVVSTEAKNGLSFDNHTFKHERQKSASSASASTKGIPTWTTMILHTSLSKNMETTLPETRGPPSWPTFMFLWYMNVGQYGWRYIAFSNIWSVRWPWAVASPVLASSGNAFTVSACTPLNHVSRPCINTAVLTDCTRWWLVVLHFIVSTSHTHTHMHAHTDTFTWWHTHTHR